MSESLKQKAISGMIWNAVERFGSSFFLFISNLVLARLLSPDDFGCIGMLLVFISVSDAIIDGGFGSALIQKKNPTPTDYSTIFFWNLLLSVSLYFTLFLVSPVIASFYEIPILSDLLKVQGIILVMNALVLIQQNILKKQIAFKKITKMNLTAIIIGSCAGISSAFAGLGVWSLVVKSLVTGMVQCIIYWLSNRWRPQWVFSWISFKELFKFGGFTLFNTVVNNLYHNLISLVIGKGFSAAVLGYYTQAEKLQSVPQQCISATVSNVIFSAFSQIQDDIERLRQAVKKSFMSMIFLNSPLLVLMIVIANPLFDLLFTEKWSQSILYFQIICIKSLIYTPHEFNIYLLMSIGKSSFASYVMICQSTLGLISIIIGIRWGMVGLLLGFTLSSYITYIIITFFTKRVIGYGLLSQLKDMAVPLLFALFSGIMSYCVSVFIHDLHNIYLIVIQVIIYVLCYILLSKIFRMEAFKIYCQIIKKK